MTKEESFRYRAEQLQKTLHVALADIAALRAVIKESDAVETKRRHLIRNADEGLDLLGRRLSNPLFEIDRMVAGYFEALSDAELKDCVPPRRYEDNSHMFQSDD